MEKFVLVIGNSLHYYQPFKRLGKISRDQGLFNRPELIELVLFTGGADISPSLYNHTPSRLTFCDPRRDVHEIIAFRRARKHCLPIAGVCRGSQFLCAMAGGTLFQHVDGHGYGYHEISTWDGRVLNVSSTHHQMQNPPTGAVPLAWSKSRLSDVYIGANDEEVEPPEVEHECVYYPNINAVGMQYHPEIMSESSKGFQFAIELVTSWLNPPQLEAA